MPLDSTTLLQILERLRGGQKETATVEFKLNWDKPEDIAGYISALGNAAALDRHDRAWMVWGVESHAPHEVRGTHFDYSTAKGAGNQGLAMWLTQKITPKPDFQFHEVMHAQGRVVMLEIHPPRAAPLSFDGVRYIRVDSHKTSLAQHPDKEARLWQALEGVTDWTGEVVPGATLADLDPAAVEFSRGKFTEYLIKGEADTTRHAKIRAEAAAWDVPTLLNKARLTKQGQVTRSALLLLGRDEAAHFLAPADVKISWILRGEDGRNLSSQHFGMPLLLSTEAVFGRIRNVPVEYMPDGTLFPTPVPQYDGWVIREALHNCIAHQDYRLGGKINLVETPESLTLSNLGTFTPPSVEWMLEHQSPPERYRNQWLIESMVRLRMIDQVGSGIRRMFMTQRERFFPMPDYAIDTGTPPRVEVIITGQVLDSKYTRVLMKRSDLDLRQVMLLDRVQKKRPLSKGEAGELKALKLLEGRAPNYFVSSKVAEWTSQKASYIRNRGFDDAYYQRLVVEYLQKYAQATRKDLDDLLLPKLPEVLDAKKKQNKVRNLLQAMRRARLITRTGAKNTGIWSLNKSTSGSADTT